MAFRFFTKLAAALVILPVGNSLLSLYGLEETTSALVASLATLFIVDEMYQGHLWVHKISDQVSANFAAAYAQDEASVTEVANEDSEDTLLRRIVN